MSNSRKLSELEGVCLGILRSHDRCTAYTVRVKLKKAPSSHWCASAGSVYPLLARLEDEGLIKADTDEDDGRGRKLLRITRNGQAALKRWLVAGADQDIISSVTDPIRSRMFFLSALNRAQRLRYIDDVIEKMTLYLEQTRERLGNEEDDLYDYLGALGATKVTLARIEWLQVVRQKLGG